MTQSSFGLEFDGDQVTVVEVVGDMAVSVRSVTLDNIDEAVELVLAGFKVKRGDAPIRASLAAPKTLLRRIDVTPAMQTRAGFEDAVYNAIRASRELTTMAGVFFDPDQVNAGAETVSGGLVAITPVEPVNAVYRAMGARPTEVVAAPFTVTTDGLWLGIRNNTADITLVVNGRPVNYRQLQAGGLNSVVGLLTDPADPDSGRTRFQAALHRTGPNDPIAEAELDRYLRLIAAEVRQSAEFFARDGENVPSSVVPYGAGAVAVGLDGALHEAGFTVEFPESITRSLGFIPPADRPLALGAYFAAVSAGRDIPQVVYPDPRATDANGTFAFLRRRVVKITAGISVAAAIIGFTVVPTAAAYLENRAARSDREKLSQQFAAYEQQYESVIEYRTRNAIALDARENELLWSRTLSMLLTTAPSGVVLSQVGASSDPIAGPSVAVTAERVGGVYADLTTWLEILRVQPDVLSAWATSFSNRGGKASYQLFIQLDPSLLRRGPDAVTSTETNPASTTSAQGTATPTAPTTTESTTPLTDEPSTEEKP